MIPVARKGDFEITCRNDRTYLHEGKHHWMDDSVMEQKTHDFAMVATGRVLVGGLGLGCIVERYQAMPEITEIVVVEIAQDEIDLVWHNLDVPKASIIHMDLKDYLITAENFDYIYMDVWPCKDHKSIPEWRELAEQIVPPNRVLCWGE